MATVTTVYPTTTAVPLILITPVLALTRCFLFSPMAVKDVVGRPSGSGGGSTSYVDLEAQETTTTSSTRIDRKLTENSDKDVKLNAASKWIRRMLDANEDGEIDVDDLVQFMKQIGLVDMLKKEEVIDKKTREWMDGFIHKLKDKVDSHGNLTSIAISDSTSEQIHQSLTKPKYLFIGPVHQKVGMSDEVKIPFLKYWVSEFKIDWKSPTMESLVIDFKRKASEAKNIYGPIINSKSEDISTEHEFAEIMLVDVAVVVGFLHAVFQSRISDERLRDYPELLRTEKIKKDIMFDILIPENQIPFLLLKKMWKKITPEGSKELMKLVVEGLCELFPYSLSTDGECGSPIHIMDLIYTKMTSPCEIEKIHPSDVEDSRWIPSASALKQVGTQFEKKLHRSFLRIKFSAATIRIPPLYLNIHSKGIIQILLKHEKELGENKNKKYFHGYVSFMGCLLRTAEDVRVLKESNIIVSSMEDSEIHGFFSALQSELDLSDRTSHYLQKVFVAINRFRPSKKQRWMFDLKYNYCRTPWIVLSVLAANILLVLSFLQTFFGILSYKKQT